MSRRAPSWAAPARDEAWRCAPLLTDVDRYTPGMKIAVSIPDDVYAEAERLTRRLNRSRSQLYTDALREYLARHESDVVTEALNRVCELVDSRPEADISAATTRVLERVEW